MTSESSLILTPAGSLSLIPNEERQPMTAFFTLRGYSALLQLASACGTSDAWGLLDNLIVGFAELVLPFELELMPVSYQRAINAGLTGREDNLNRPVPALKNAKTARRRHLRRITSLGDSIYESTKTDSTGEKGQTP